MGPVETGLMIYAAVTLYWSLLGTYMLVKTDVISVKAAPIIIGYSLFAWLTSRIMYINFPEIPPHPILILSRVVDSPQGILTTIYVYVRTKVIKIKWMPYIIGYSFFLAVSRITMYLLRDLPVPEILVLPTLLAGWAGYPVWFYVYTKANRVFTPKAAYALASYQVIVWAVSIIMLYQLGLPYSIISSVQMLMEYPSTIVTLILVDRYRLRNLGVYASDEL